MDKLPFSISEVTKSKIRITYYKASTDWKALIKLIK